MNTTWLAVALASLALGLSAWAQTPERVLSGKDVTEAALIEALTPGQEPILTRGIGVERNVERRPMRAKPASASLLITFETNSAALTTQAKAALNVVGEALGSEKLAPFRFSIQGHADPRGNPEANRKLSQLRAESVRNYLVHNKNIDDPRLEAVGKGDTELMNKENPVAPENRRVTIVNLAQQ